MDSTLADLDEEIQEVIRQQFLNIHKKMGMTVIYVTENQKSAMALGSRMIVMNGGEICQDDAPENLVKYPKTGYVAGVVGYPPMNFFAATVYEDNGKAGLAIKKNKILLPDEKGCALLEHGYVKKEVLVGVRADALHVVAGKKKGGEGELTCKIQGMGQIYSRPVLKFMIEETAGICMADEMPAGGEGSSLVLSMDTDKIQIFDRETDRTIVY